MTHLQSEVRNYMIIIIAYCKFKWFPVRSGVCAAQSEWIIEITDVVPSSRILAILRLKQAVVRRCGTWSRERMLYQAFSIAFVCLLFSISYLSRIFDSGTVLWRLFNMAANVYLGISALTSPERWILAWSILDVQRQLQGNGFGSLKWVNIWKMGQDFV